MHKSSCSPARCIASCAVSENLIPLWMPALRRAPVEKIKLYVLMGAVTLLLAACDTGLEESFEFLF
jgi:hypothetical protein